MQALFPARTKEELTQRIETPLLRVDVEARIRPVLGDFDLFGPTPFLQITPPPSLPKSDGAAPFVTREDTLGNQRVVDELRRQIGAGM